MNTTKPGHDRRASATVPMKNTRSGNSTPVQRGWTILSGLTNTSSRIPTVFKVLSMDIGSGQIGKKAKSQNWYIDVCVLSMACEYL